MTGIPTPTSIARPRRAGSCFCGRGKVCFATEAAALAAAAKHADTYSVDFTVYLCPGTEIWHLTTGGMHPASLKSAGRIFAWHLWQLKVLDPDAILTGMRIGKDSRKRTLRMLEHLITAGAAARRADNRVELLDPAPVLRIMQIGWDRYYEQEVAERPAPRNRSTCSPPPPSASC